jgi:hypothetical protein
MPHAGKQEDKRQGIKKFESSGNTEELRYVEKTNEFQIELKEF